MWKSRSRKGLAMPSLCFRGKNAHHYCRPSLCILKRPAITANRLSPRTHNSLNFLREFDPCRSHGLSFLPLRSGRLNRFSDSPRILLPSNAGFTDLWLICHSDPQANSWALNDLQSPIAWAEAMAASRPILPGLLWLRPLKWATHLRYGSSLRRMLLPSWRWCTCPRFGLPGSPLFALWSVFLLSWVVTSTMPKRWETSDMVAGPHSVAEKRDCLAAMTLDQKSERKIGETSRHRDGRGSIVSLAIWH